MWGRNRFQLGSSTGARPIRVWVEPPYHDGEYVLVLHWAGSPHFVEVRGAFDTGEDSDFQRVIDALPGPLVGGELFSGNVATVMVAGGGRKGLYADAWPVLAEILRREGA